MTVVCLSGVSYGISVINTKEKLKEPKNTGHENGFLVIVGNAAMYAIGVLFAQGKSIAMEQSK